MKHIALSIAGFDNSAGAGIQADLKTFSALGCYGMNVLTALPIQNTMGVKKCYELPIKSIEEQLETIFEDITPHAIKIGMIYNLEIINVVASFLKKHAKNIPIVLDPVMIAKSGDYLLLPSAIDALKEELLPIATIVTPNICEAIALTGKQENLSQEIISLGAQTVLLKGGHLEGEFSTDILLTKEGLYKELILKRIITKKTHGTGCTLSAAIASFLARGFDLETSCINAKQYLTNAIISAKNQTIGKGNGPVDHFYSGILNSNFFN